VSVSGALLSAPCGLISQHEATNPKIPLFGFGSFQPARVARLGSSVDLRLFAFAFLLAI
jgi:hypothetical protein